MGRACLAILLLGSSALAQLDSTPLRHLKVRLKFANGACDRSAQVELIGSSGPVVDRKPNDQCEVDFLNVPSGTYHLEVSGLNFTQIDEVITTSNGISDLELEVKNRSEGMSRSGAGPLVSASALSIPPKALKEFEKSNELLGHQEYQKAMQRLTRAIAIYPTYAAAYNNLGAVYAHLGDRVKERDALEKAITIDDHLAAAYLNLGRMHIADNDFSGGEDVLNKAAAYNPSEPTALVLLSYCQFQDRHFDDAIATSHRAHALPGQHSSVHLVAAKAFEQKRDAPGAIGELELFLKEEPTGERADQARKDLNVLHAIHQ